MARAFSPYAIERPQGASDKHDPAPTTIFTARGLTKIYQMGEVTVQALRGIDLEIYEREFVVLLGPSGSGKSTLLNILGGLETATAGEVLWRDHDLVRADDRELTQYRREPVGFVFQFYNQIPAKAAVEAQETFKTQALEPA